MSLSPLPARLENNRSNSLRPAFSWIERFVLPLVVSAMEVQPLALVVVLLSFFFTGRLAASSISIGLLFLLFLFSLAWAMLVEYGIQRWQMKKPFAINLFHLISWPLAFAVIAFPWLAALLTGTISPMLFISVALVTWLWRRALSYVRGGFDYSSLMTAFKVGFGILLFVLLLALIVPIGSLLLVGLTTAAPIFFLCGLIALSLARLITIRREHRSQDAQADPLRPWLLALLVLALIAVVLVSAIELVFSLSSGQFLLSFLTPLWNGLNTIIDWLLYGVIFVFVYPIFALFQLLLRLVGRKNLANSGMTFPRTKPSQVRTVTHTTALPPQLVAGGHWLVLILFFVLIGIVLWGGLTRLRTFYAAEGVDESRESLDARSLLQQRFHDWWNSRRGRKVMLDLEPLDPTSARAQYRRFLQQIAASDSNKAKRPYETPEEYELRLRSYLEQAPGPPEQKGQCIFLIHELTRAYTQERYGARSLSAQQRASLPMWVDYLLAQLTERTTRSSVRRE